MVRFLAAPHVWLEAPQNPDAEVANDTRGNDTEPN
jgi:hypothetical protein